MLRQGLALLISGWVVLGATSYGWAQQPGGATAGPVPPATLRPVPPQPEAPSGPVIWVADVLGRLGTVNLGSGAVSVKGFMKNGSRTVVMTDIAFCPGGALYGITFGSDRRLYRITTTTNPRATPIGSHGQSGLNALVCDAAGQLFAHSFNTARLFKVNKSTGATTVVGSTGSVRSAGDLAFHEGGLFLTNTTKGLTKLNARSGAVLSTRLHNVRDMFGLVSTATNRLYGVAGTKIYLFAENAAGPTGAVSVARDFTGRGLGATFGAAFNGNF